MKVITVAGLGGFRLKELKEIEKRAKELGTKKDYFLDLKL